MNDHQLRLAIIVSIGALILILFIGIIIFICTYHTKIYKRFKKPVKTMGIIDDTEYVSPPPAAIDGSYTPPGHYTVTYSYTDNMGQRHTASFQWQRNIGKAGDKIAVHYDSQNPQDSIADCQLKYGKNLWWKVLIALAIIFVPSIFIAIFLEK